METIAVLSALDASWTSVCREKASALNDLNDVDEDMSTFVQSMAEHQCGKGIVAEIALDSNIVRFMNIVQRTASSEWGQSDDAHVQDLLVRPCSTTHHLLHTCSTLAPRLLHTDF